MTRSTDRTSDSHMRSDSDSHDATPTKRNGTNETTTQDPMSSLRDVLRGNAGRIYMVEWSHHDLLKIGVTAGHRWESFTARGAELRYLSEPLADATTREMRMHAQVRSVGWPTAFGCREAAVPFLGRGGNGWTECYRLGVPGEHRDLLAELIKIDELAARRLGA